MLCSTASVSSVSVSCEAMAELRPGDHVYVKVVYYNPTDVFSRGTATKLTGSLYYILT